MGDGDGLGQAKGAMNNTRDSKNLVPCHNTCGKVVPESFDESA